MKIFWLFVSLSLVFCANALYAGSPARVQQFINHKDWNFVENKGQIASPDPAKGTNAYNFHPEIKYYGHQGGVYLYCKPGMLSFVFTKAETKNDEPISEATACPVETGCIPSLHGIQHPLAPTTISTNRPSPAIAIATARADLVLLNSNPNAEIIATMSGKLIGVLVNKSLLQGNYSSDINAEKYHLNPGVYLLKFMVNGSVENRKVELY